MNWLFWQMGSAPYLGGGFRPFLRLCAGERGSIRSTGSRWRSKRQLDVLARRLADNRITWPATPTPSPTSPIWPLVRRPGAQGKLYDAGDFLDVQSYKNVQRWTAEIAGREPVKRGRMVNRKSGKPEEVMLERHSADDFERVWKEAAMAEAS